MELEAKYLIDSPRRAQEAIELVRSQGYSVRPAGETAIEDRYFDTERWRLARAGWAFRIRCAGGRYELTLKSLGSTDRAIHRREEIEQELEGTAPQPGELPAGVVQEKLAALVGQEELREKFQIENRRTVYLARSEDSGVELEIAFDDAAVCGDGERLPFRELEIELVAGDGEELKRIAATLDGKDGLLPARLSKFERGLQLIGASVPYREPR